MKKKRVMFLSFIVIALCIVACRQTLPDQTKESMPGNEGKDLISIRVAVQQYYISSPIGYIIDNRLDEMFGLKLVPVEYPSGAEQIMDIEKDVYDVATIGAAFLYPVSENKAVVIGEHIKSKGGDTIYARKGSPILDVKGFNPTYPEVYGDFQTAKGCTILLKENTTLQYIGMKWMESIGVKEDAVNVEYGDFDEIYRRFAKGHGDVAVLGAPYSYQAEKDGYKRVADSASLHADMYEVVLATNRAHKEKRPELVKFMQLILYANEKLEDDFQAKLKNTEKWYQNHGGEFTKDLLEKECKDKILVTRDNYNPDDFGEFEKKYAEYMAAIGNITPQNLPNVESNVDKELFLEAFCDLKQE